VLPGAYKRVFIPLPSRTKQNVAAMKNCPVLNISHCEALPNIPRAKTKKGTGVSADP
jgi:hypothetical protein